MTKNLASNNLAEMHALLDSAPNRTPSQESMLAMLTFLHANGYGGYVDLKEQIILSGMHARDARVKVQIHFHPSTGLCTLVMRWVEECIPASRKVLANLLHRINYDLQAGLFGLDESTGACVYAIHHFFGSTPMDDEHCMYVAALASQQMVWYADTLLPIMRGQRPDFSDACPEYIELSREDPSLLRGLGPNNAELN